MKIKGNKLKFYNDNNNHVGIIQLVKPLYYQAVENDWLFLSIVADVKYMIQSQSFSEQNDIVQELIKEFNLQIIVQQDNELGNIKKEG